MYINILCLFVNASNIPVIFYCCSRKYIFLSAVLIYNFFHHVSGFIFSPLWDWSVWYPEECLCTIIRCSLVYSSRCGWVQVYKGHLTEHATVHDAVVDLYCGDDRQGHRLWEGTSSEGGDEGDGSRQHGALGVVVHYQFQHDARLSPSPCHCTQGSCCSPHQFTTVIIHYMSKQASSSQPLMCTLIQ